MSFYLHKCVNCSHEMTLKEKDLGTQVNCTECEFKNRIPKFLRAQEESALPADDAPKTLKEKVTNGFNQVDHTNPYAEDLANQKGICEEDEVNASEALVRFIEYLKKRDSSLKQGIATYENNKHFAQALTKYKKNFTVGELPIFAGIGYDLFVTNKKVYGERTISLEEVFIVSTSKFSLTESYSDGSPRTDLLINGIPIVNCPTGLLPIDLLQNSLEKLGGLRRQEIQDDGHVFNLPYGIAPFIAASGICDNRSHTNIFNKIQETGEDENYASTLINYMKIKNTEVDRSGGLLMLAIGLGMVGLTFLISFIMKSSGSPVYIVFKGVAVLGVFIALKGVGQCITGSQGMNEAQLVRAWENKSRA